MVPVEPGRKTWPLWTLAGLTLLLVCGGLFLWQQAATAQGQPATADRPPTEKQKPDQPVKPTAEKPQEVPYPLAHRISLPPDIFDSGTDWLNTAGPIELADLRGKIVLVDFWTYCCINCIHVLPDLKYLEHKFANELVVIGCHSAKFDNEKESENIRDAILRYEIEHPVVNDSEMRIWRRFGIRSWPSLLVIDAEGKACLLLSGEGNRETMEQVITRLIAYHESNGTLDRTPVRFDLERNNVEETPLRYPGKLLADTAGGRLFISDSNHNRIVVTTLDGKLLDIIGSGEIGAADGTFDKASFDHPQGMTLVGETLYVADTENHLIRTIDLKAKTVGTLAGTGEQATFRTGGGTLRQTALNSPWDLLHVNGTLYIAMAGPHQLWSHKLGSNDIGVFSGTGREDITNGPHDAAAYAQPSGLATDADGKFLYVCDSEGSAIRQVELDPAGKATTVVGPSDLPLGRALFEFGDVDGKGDAVRLQHCLGVDYQDGQLFVADSYNHKIKQIDLATSQATTILGTGKPGNQLEPSLELSEPAGLDVVGDTLFIADTNNHRVLKVNLKTKQAEVLEIAGLKPPVSDKDTKADAVGESVPVAPQTVAVGKDLEFSVTLAIPEGYKLNDLAPVRYRLEAAGEQSLIPADHLEAGHKVEAKDGRATFRVPLTGTAGKAELTLTFSYGYCRDGEGGLCKIKSVRWSIPLTVAETTQQKQVALSVPDAK